MESTKTQGREKKVSVKLFKGAGAYEDDAQVIVNGKVFIIRRGESVTVPDYVAQILKQQEEQLAVASKIS